MHCLFFFLKELRKIYLFCNNFRVVLNIKKSLIIREKNRSLTGFCIPYFTNGSSLCGKGGTCSVTSYMQFPRTRRRTCLIVWHTSVAEEVIVIICLGVICLDLGAISRRYAPAQGCQSTNLTIFSNVMPGTFHLELMIIITSA